MKKACNATSLELMGAKVIYWDKKIVKDFVNSEFRGKSASAVSLCF